MNGSSEPRMALQSLFDLSAGGSSQVPGRTESKVFTGTVHRCFWDGLGAPENQV